MEKYSRIWGFAIRLNDNSEVPYFLDDTVHYTD